MEHPQAIFGRVSPPCNSQLPSITGLSLESIKMSITNEVNNNVEEYMSFALSVASLTQQMKAYILYRDYDSAFGDMVPLVLARAYSINITILDTSNSEAVTVHKIHPRDKSGALSDAANVCNVS